MLKLSYMPVLNLWFYRFEFVFTQIKSKQILFRNNKITFYISNRCSMSITQNVLNASSMRKLSYIFTK